MTATITNLQNDLQQALDGMVPSSPFPFNVRIQEADITAMPDDPGIADVVIGFEASARLGRTGKTILEQYLVPITIKRQYLEGKQCDLADSHDLAEFLRDELACFHTPTARVDQLLAPHPFDAPLAITPGLYNSRFVLDMDVLRSIWRVDQDTTTPTKALTLTRQAAWDALNNWPEWNTGTWKRKFYLDKDLDELALHDPAGFELPALAITWGSVSPRFFVHTAQEWPATLNVTAWFPAHQTTMAEYRATQIVRAIYQCGPPGQSGPPVSYIRAATGRIPEKDAPISLEPVELGRSRQLKAIKVTCSFVLTNIVSPLYD